MILYVRLEMSSDEYARWDAGELDAGVDAARLARTIESMLGGSLLSWAFYQEGPASRWVRADIEAVLAPYLPAKKKAPRRGSSQAG